MSNAHGVLHLVLCFALSSVYCEQEVTVISRNGRQLGVFNATSAALYAHRPRATVICVSDTHGLHASRPQVIKTDRADVMLFAGDSGLRTSRQARAFSSWLSTQPVTHRVVTYGNMDTWGAGYPQGSQQYLPDATVLVDEGMEVAGWRVWASPWTPRFAGVYQLEDDEAAERHWSKVLPPDADVDVLMTHGPPYGYGDLTQGRHVGDGALLKAVQAMVKPPLLWVVGHVHASMGQYTVPHPRGDILMLNVAAYNLRSNDARAAPRLVELPSLKITPMV